MDQITINVYLNDKFLLGGVFGNVEGLRDILINKLSKDPFSDKDLCKYQKILRDYKDIPSISIENKEMKVRMVFSR